MELEHRADELIDIYLGIGLENDWEYLYIMLGQPTNDSIHDIDSMIGLCIKYRISLGSYDYLDYKCIGYLKITNKENLKYIYDICDDHYINIHKI